MSTWRLLCRPANSLCRPINVPALIVAVLIDVCCLCRYRFFSRIYVGVRKDESMDIHMDMHVAVNVAAVDFVVEIASLVVTAHMAVASAKWLHSQGERSVRHLQRGAP